MRIAEQWAHRAAPDEGGAPGRGPHTPSSMRRRSPIGVVGWWKRFPLDRMPVAGRGLGKQLRKPPGGGRLQGPGDAPRPPAGRRPCPWSRGRAEPGSKTPSGATDCLAMLSRTPRDDLARRSLATSPTGCHVAAARPGLADRRSAVSARGQRSLCPGAHSPATHLRRTASMVQMATMTRPSEHPGMARP